MADYKTPGQLVEKLLIDKGWTKRTLAVVLEKGESTIHRIVVDKQPIDARTAILLEEVFGVSADTFLSLQREYDLAVARISVNPDPQRAKRAYLYGDLPIPEMVKRGWLRADNAHNIQQVEGALKVFFGVASLDEIEILPHSAKKTMKVNTDTTPAQLAWLYRAKSIAKEVLVRPYSKRALQAALPKLKELMCAPEEARYVSRVLSQCGIRFVVVETLKSANIDGVCFWLNGSSPVIGMSLRYDRIDNFWFVLRHEIEHVLQGHGMNAMVLDADLEGDRASTGPDVSDEEAIANDAAANYCVPQDKLNAFISAKEPLFSERDLLGFAKLVGVHPGILAGQIQHKTKRYDRFRQHQAKIRPFVTVNSITDGWGDVYPLGD